MIWDVRFLIMDASSSGRSRAYCFEYRIDGEGAPG